MGAHLYSDRIVETSGEPFSSGCLNGGVNLVGVDAGRGERPGEGGAEVPGAGGQDGAGAGVWGGAVTLSPSTRPCSGTIQSSVGYIFGLQSRQNRKAGKRGYLKRSEVKLRIHVNQIEFLFGSGADVEIEA